MSKRFNGFLLVSLLASLLVFVNCSDDGDDITASDLISPYNVANSTWLTFTDVTTSTKHSWKSLGFEDPGSGIYQLVASSTTGTGQFTIVLSSGHQSYMTYDQTQLDITYVDDAGTTWENVSGQDFTLTLYEWPDVGGKVSGIFSGTLQQFGGATLKEISGGTFKVKVTN